MPVWHALTEAARDAGQLTVLGVIQEQHAERCRLFAQWHKIDWPILHDPINRLKARAVPMFVAIDEAGVVVDDNLKADELAGFLSRPPSDASKPEQAPASAGETVPNAASNAATDRPIGSEQSRQSASAFEASADERILWGDKPKSLTRAIEEYRQATQLAPGHASTFFSLGVAHRLRFDSANALPNDFQSAIDAWSTALELDPNHYIYRRRIQQYGPRLTKPYPFYDWVAQAKREIRQRGETPVELQVEPSGAEIAQPIRDFEMATTPHTEPDPDGRITRDRFRWIEASSVVVPSQIHPGETARIHVNLRPTSSVHWNNEAEPLKLWINAPNGWSVHPPLLEAQQPAEAESHEVRHLEFEIRSPTASSAPDEDEAAEAEPEDADQPSTTKSVELSAYALYYVCEEQGGQCLFLRLDIPIRVSVESTN